MFLKKNPAGAALGAVFVFLFNLNVYCLDIGLDFARMPDKKAAVMEIMGLRSAESAGDNMIRLTIGPSCTDACGIPSAYRIISPDDTNYKYCNFVEPLRLLEPPVQQAELALPPDVNVTTGYTGADMIRTTLTLVLPHKMKEGCLYSVVAIGKGDKMVTAGKTAASFIYGSTREKVHTLRPEDVMGLRGVSSIGNGILMLEFGHAFSISAGMQKRSYVVRINKEVQEITDIGRRSLPDVYDPRAWPYKAFVCHEIFLKLNHPLNDGDTVCVETHGVTTGNAADSFIFHSKKTISPSIKVNQIGYLTDSPCKNAYMGRWLGSLPEGSSQTTAEPSLDDLFSSVLTKSRAQTSVLSLSALAFTEPPPFFIIDSRTGEHVYQGKTVLTHNGKDPDLKINHSGENVYLLDFTDFNTEGNYYISVPSVGRSFSFRIGRDVYEKPFMVQAAGIYAQRCGIALEPPYSHWRRIACHSKGITATSLLKYQSESEFGDFHNNQLRDPNPDYNSGVDKTIADKKSLLLYMPLNGNLEDAGPEKLRPSLTAAPPVFASDSKNPGMQYLATTSGKNGMEIPLNNVDFSKGATILFRYIRTVTSNGQFDGDLIGFKSGDKWGKGVTLSPSWGLLGLCAGRDREIFKRIMDNRWHHFAITVRKSGNQVQASLYCDGAKACGLDSQNVSLMPVLILFGITGPDAKGSGIRDVAVLNKVLSPLKIAELSRPFESFKPRIYQASGGHHDAGDYNPRCHLDVAQELMDAYETAPGKFRDAQLNIPENNNGIPDILDEALWALKVWKELQLPDGALPGGTESSKDPNFIQTVELDDTGDYAWKEDSKATFEFAGAAAQMSRILGKFRKEEAADFLNRAVKAYEWASVNPPKSSSLQVYAANFVNCRAYAAAQLFHATGDDRYNLDFMKNTPWMLQDNADMIVHKKYDLSRAAYCYANLPDGMGNNQVKISVRKAILREADMYISGSSKMGYKFTRHPYAPVTWGTGAYQNAQIVVNQAWRITKNRKYLEWMVRSCDNTLGANPLGLCWITGLGVKTIHAPLHNSRYNPTGFPVRGQQAQGPNAGGDGYSYRECAYPPHSEYMAVMYSFADMHFAINMDEGTVSNQVRTLATFGLLLPE